MSRYGKGDILVGVGKKTNQMRASGSCTPYGGSDGGTAAQRTVLFLDVNNGHAVRVTLWGSLYL